jgi:hypothetical protein
MKIRIDQPVRDFSGKALENEKKEIITFRYIIETALNSQSNENPLTAEKKLYAFQIGVKLFSKKRDEYDLTVEQISFLKERIGLFFTTIAYGRFLELIGDESTKLEEEEKVIKQKKE